MRNKYPVLFFVILLYHSFAFAQIKMDLGGIAGVSFYMGDINPSRLFYSPQPSGGILYRCNFDSRYSLRGSFFYGTLSANDMDFNNIYQQSRNHSFSSPVLDFAVQAEFNFLPYSVGNEKAKRSTYLLAGVSYAMLPGSQSPSQFALPLGFGYKINIVRNWAFGIEWSFRKTFSDDIDGLGGKEFISNSYKQTAFANNNDWYSFCGVFLTYMIFSQELKCAAYGEKKKH